MGVVTFDTLKFVKRLEEVGMSQKETEAIATAQSEAFEELTKTKKLAIKKIYTR